MRSEEQIEYVGECLDCYASIYRLPTGILWVDDPAPGCLCRVEGEEEDEAEQRENLIRANIKEEEDDIIPEIYSDT